MKNPDILAATKPDAEAFEKLGILYYIGGSVASSTVKLNHSPKVSGLTNQSSDDVLVRVENVSNKFCRNLKRSLWYGMQYLGSELPCRQRGDDDKLRKDEFWAIKVIYGESLLMKLIKKITVKFHHGFLTQDQI